jgi:glycosyl hydrolase family 44
MGTKWTIIGLGASVLLATGFVIARDSPFRAWADAAQLDPSSPRIASYALECSAQSQPISPLIYGVGGHVDAWTAGVTARRHGGNPTSRYNWELDTYNAASDWFFKNAGGSNPGSALDPFITENMQHGAKTALTLPILEWVAKDNSSYSFPVSVFGRQKAMAPEDPNMGNGVGLDDKPIQPGPPTVTSVRSTPETIEKWVRTIREKDKTRGRSVDSYILDNEPMLWNSTHRDVHPEPVTYDELLERTIAYGTAIRRADPEGKIAGPAEWGWLAYHYSAKDTAAGKVLRPDRRAHGDVPLIPWYLRKLREHEQKTGVKLLDILDVHFYPMAEGVHEGKTDAFTNARRLRSTRSLWDPTYKDESWIDERMQVLPLLKQWIAQNYPGLGLSIGEWNFGAGKHMSGGLATAEVLGRFGVEGVTSAYIWGGPDEKTPTFWAFRAYRNFDGQGGHFQDWSVPVKGDGTFTSLFASRDEKREKLVAVLLNLSPLSRLTARLTLPGCGAVSAARGFTYTGGDAGFTNLPVESTDGVSVVVAPYSINVIDLTTGTAKP